SETDRTAIQAVLSSSETSIHILKAEISKLQAATRLLQSRLSNIHRYADSHCSLLSPMRQLPDELLAVIFFYLCDTLLLSFHVVQLPM
ncbi:hypothetical protein BDQ17DRAFT_1242285, partial [Cyathus striatus]